MTDQTENVQKYYGETLTKSEDLKTNACCTDISYPDHIKKALGQIHDEVMAKYYGCGLTIPNELENCKVLDLGSGSGRDCYLLSKLVGEDGEVVGVDMTKEQLDVSNKHIDFHTNLYNYKKPNVSFLEGNIEKLGELNLKDNYFDIIISNCVVNLANDKEAVLREAYRTLKPGGELYFSDVYSNRRIPAELVKDPVLFGECLSGALYWNDFLNLSKKVGFIDPRSVEFAPITINNKEVQEKTEGIKFFSVTYRLFKLDQLEADCEDYGHSVKYQGGMFESPESFMLDDHHKFPKGKRTSVCGNSYLMLKESRFNKYFEFSGNFSTHLGIFEGCGEAMPFNNDKSTENSGSCC